MRVRKRVRTCALARTGRPRPQRAAVQVHVANLAEDLALLPALVVPGHRTWNEEMKMGSMRTCAALAFPFGARALSPGINYNS